MHGIHSCDKSFGVHSGVFITFHTFQLQLRCTMTNKAAAAVLAQDRVHVSQNHISFFLFTSVLLNFFIFHVLSFVVFFHLSKTFLNFLHFSFFLKFTFVADTDTTLHGVHADTAAFSPTVWIKL